MTRLILVRAEGSSTIWLSNGLQRRRVADDEVRLLQRLFTTTEVVTVTDLRVLGVPIPEPLRLARTVDDPTIWLGDGILRRVVDLLELSEVQRWLARSQNDTTVRTFADIRVLGAAFPPDEDVPEPEPPAGTCVSPWFTTAERNGGIAFGDYYIHNNIWNPEAPANQSLHVCSPASWFVRSGPYSGTAVKTFPNVHRDMPDAFGAGVPWSDYSTVSARFASSVDAEHQTGGIWNVAFDIWLNGVGWGGGSTEVMIWTENRGQRPAGERLSADVAIGGTIWQQWHLREGDANVVTFVALTPVKAGTVDIKALVDFGIQRGLIPQGPTVHQLGYGIEICDTAGTVLRYDVTDFELTMTKA